MFRPLFLYTKAALLPLSPIIAEQPPDLFAPPSNAALVYWQGFSCFTDLSKEERTLLNSFVGSKAAETPFDAGKARKLLDTRSVALHAIRSGTAIAHCDWGTDYRRGPGVYNGHLSPLLGLYQLLLVQLRLDLAEGLQDQAGL